MEININQLINRTINGNLDSDSHLMTLYSLTLSMKAKTIFELGVRDGNTTPSFLLAAEKLNAVVHSVDINQTKFVVPSRFKKHWRFHKSDALDFLRNWKGAVPDIIYVDDWHAYTHVKKELEIIDKITNPSCLIILHDSMYYNTEPKYHIDLKTNKLQWKDGGPARAILELNKDKWEWVTVPCCHGLTILRKNGGITP